MLANIEKLIDTHQVISFVGNMGTPTAAVAALNRIEERIDNDSLKTAFETMESTG